MAKTGEETRCEFCRLIWQHFAGCPTEIGTPESRSIFSQAYQYAYWQRDLRQEVLQRRSPTFRVGYMIGKSDRDFADQAEEERRWVARQRHRQRTGADGNACSGHYIPILDADE